MNDMSILFNGGSPVDTSEFLTRLKAKVSEWGDFAVPLRGDYDRLSPLEATWNMNCRALNNAINNKETVMKYVISAPTGSAKTESLITYCSMLPQSFTALISTNLTDEADNIAQKINDEAQHIRAHSYHSKKEDDEKLDIDEVAKFQIVVTTHSFYKNNYAGSDKWAILGAKRDLLVIDEALETMQEYSVKDDSITRAITIFKYIQKSNKFKDDVEFDTELNLLQDELRVLEGSAQGTILQYTDTITNDGLGLTLFGAKDKYKLFLQILGQM